MTSVARVEDVQIFLKDPVYIYVCVCVCVRARARAFWPLTVSQARPTYINSMNISHCVFNRILTLYQHVTVSETLFGCGL